MDIREPQIKRENILFLQDDQFNTNKVCIVTGSGTGIGRATAIAAAANNLMTVGLDINETEGTLTQKMAREMGGQMIFIKTDLCKDEDVENAVSERIKYNMFRRYQASSVIFRQCTSNKFYGR